MTRFVDRLIARVYPIYRGQRISARFNGHCAFPASPDSGRYCGAPAVWHFRIDVDGACVFVCGRHETIVRANIPPLDWHQVGHDCIPERSLWHSTGTPGESFCFTEPDTHAETSVETRELVGVGR